MSTPIILALLLAVVVYQAFVTVRVVKSDQYSSGQRISQTILIWVVPLVGAVAANVSRVPRTMRSWLTAEKTYEGFPLLLRRPADLDVASLRPSFPTLAVVSHEFTKRKPNGLPEPDYDDGLAEMDHEVVTAFDANRMGVAALVETFGGKRNYYIYVTKEADVARVMSAVARHHPDERLSWSFRADPDWTFIERYAREHF